MVRPRVNVRKALPGAGVNRPPAQESSQGPGDAVGYAPTHPAGRQVIKRSNVHNQPDAGSQTYEDEFVDDDDVLLDETHTQTTHVGGRSDDYDEEEEPDQQQKGFLTGLFGGGGASDGSARQQGSSGVPSSPPQSGGYDGDDGQGGDDDDGQGADAPRSIDDWRFRAFTFFSILFVLSLSWRIYVAYTRKKSACCDTLTSPCVPPKPTRSFYQPCSCACNVILSLTGIGFLILMLYFNKNAVQARREAAAYQDRKEKMKYVAGFLTIPVLLFATGIVHLPKEEKPKSPAYVSGGIGLFVLFLLITNYRSYYSKMLVNFSGITAGQRQTFNKGGNPDAAQHAPCRILSPTKKEYPPTNKGTFNVSITRATDADEQEENKAPEKGKYDIHKGPGGKSTAMFVTPFSWSGRANEKPGRAPQNFMYVPQGANCSGSGRHVSSPQSYGHQGMPSQQGVGRSYYYDAT